MLGFKGGGWGSWAAKKKSNSALLCENIVCIHSEGFWSSAGFIQEQKLMELRGSDNTYLPALEAQGQKKNSGLENLENKLGPIP